MIFIKKNFFLIFEIKSHMNLFTLYITENICAYLHDIDLKKNEILFASFAESLRTGGLVGGES